MNYLVLNGLLECRDVCTGSATYCSFFCGQCEIFSDEGICCGQGGRMPVNVASPF